MKDEFKVFESYEELIKFFNNPLIKKQIELTKLNAKRSVATEMLKEYLKLFCKITECESIDLKWDKTDNHLETSILFQKY